MRNILLPRPNVQRIRFRIACGIFFLCIFVAAQFFSESAAMAQVNSPEKKEVVQDEKADEQEKFAYDMRVESENKVKDKLFALTLHRPNYFLGITYNDNPNQKTYIAYGKEVPNKYEAKFQFSFKMLMWENIFNGKGDLYAAYTQLSLWQIYNTSSPFRETNFEPELFLKFDTDFNFLGLQNKLFLFGINHQSNGQDVPLSRSWNRIYIEFIATRGNCVLGLKPWYRIPESSENDDNPDIDEYLGYGKLFGAYKLGRHVFSFTLHNNLDFSENRGAIEVGWSCALTRNLRAYLQYYNGYGESLVDYDNLTNRVGIGLMINDWL